VAECTFCAIGRGEGPATYVYRDERAVAIEDLHPVAPVHVLVIPREHIETVRQLKDHQLLGHLFDVAHQVAGKKGIAKDGYRLLFNVGPHGGQVVYHVHLHVLGGRFMSWPPG
jgi:histidine triad (HIT) family protein